jgi:hypothetical protein
MAEPGSVFSAAGDRGLAGGATGRAITSSAAFRVLSSDTTNGRLRILAAVGIFHDDPAAAVTVRTNPLTGAATATSLRLTPLAPRPSPNGQEASSSQTTALSAVVFHLLAYFLRLNENETDRDKVAVRATCPVRYPEFAGAEVAGGCACFVGEYPKWTVRMEVYGLGASMELQQKHKSHQFLINLEHTDSV